MATNQRKRQKKLERRSAKRKERRRELVAEKNRSLTSQLTDAARAPILDCLISESYWEHGIGTLLISRKMPNGWVALGNFLVDRYCLGVKDAFGRVLSLGEYNEFLEHYSEHNDLVELPPADARKLVEGAVDYARRLGFEPHPDYHRARPIFGDIDPNDSTEEFFFGDDDGKPYFFAGPHDDVHKCRRILATLEESCGPDGYHFTVPLSVGSPSGGNFTMVSGGEQYVCDRYEEEDEDLDDETF